VTGSDEGTFRVVLVTGLSGAGKSSALKMLEDIGYEAVDNLPLSLLERLLPGAGAGPSDQKAIAVGIDSRTRNFRAGAMVDTVARLAARSDLTVDLVYFDCDEDVLVRRFTETRRRHPLAADRPVADGIAAERDLLAPVRDATGLVFDTSTLSLPDLRRQIEDYFALAGRSGPVVTVMSFSYRGGLPREADLVFDVRFLANPHYVDALRPRTGLDADVAAYIAADANYSPFIGRLEDLMTSLLPHYRREGKSYLTIAIGCTGGQHRSVFVASELAKRISGGDHVVILRHRDMKPVSG
jgi:UPF0042 nucleotide-binding protein